MKPRKLSMSAGLGLVLAGSLLAPAVAQNPCPECWERERQCLANGTDPAVCEYRLNQCLKQYNCPV